MENFLLNNNEIESCFRSKPLQYASSYSLEELINKTKELNKYNIIGFMLKQNHLIFSTREK